MGLESWYYVKCDSCGRRASGPLFSDDAAAKVADMRGYQVDKKGNWLCRDCQHNPPLPACLAVPNYRAAS